MSEDIWQGCYGEKLNYDELDRFLIDCFMLDDIDEQLGCERFGTNIIGHTGMGKTSKIKQLARRKVEWRGKKYDGYDVRSVPIAQFEEMGDLHGMPVKHALIKRPANEGGIGKMEERWVPTDMVQEYLKLGGWGINHTEGIRTLYAPPEWVPTEIRPTILNLDDWNRANGRIIKGCMQFLQEYGLMSWKLPPGCHITLTMNPDEQDYFVTSVDSAVMQRLRSATLKFDKKEWAVWATRNKVDQRVVSFVLAYPEMMTAQGTRSSPRSISEFGRFLYHSGIGSISDKRIARRVQIMAASMLDDELVSSLITFMTRDFEMIVSPEDILSGKESVYTHLKDLMSRKEKRIDIVSVTVDRLFAHLCLKEVEPTDTNVKNVQRFLTCPHLEEEMRYVFVDRLNKASDQDPSMESWFSGNKKLVNLIMDLV